MTKTMMHPLPLPMIDFRQCAKSLARTDPELDLFIRSIRSLDLDPNEMPNALLDDTFDAHMHYPLIERALTALFLIDSYIDEPDKPLFDYFSDSCCDELTEMLDFHPINDDDNYALIRRIDDKLYEITDDFSNIY